jgi:hypothetical protein
MSRSFGDKIGVSAGMTAEPGKFFLKRKLF